MRSIFHLVLFVFLSSITMSFSFFKSNPRDYADVAREIRSKVGKKLASRHQMDCIGVGGGMMGSVYMIELAFQIHHPMDATEARSRIVDCVEELLKAINDNEEIRPYLKNYPFTTKNVKVAIFTNYLDGREVFDPDIRVVSVFESDKVTFFTMEPNNPRYKNEYSEPYQEALEKVKGLCPSI